MTPLQPALAAYFEKTPPSEKLAALLALWPAWLSAPAADDLYQHLRAHTPWRAESLRLFGKTQVLRRQVAWYGEGDYAYAGQCHRAVPMPSVIAALCQRLNQEGQAWLAAPLNSVLLNFYPDGQSGMGWHSDDEKSLGEAPVIASLSLGAVRRFQFRHKQDRRTKYSLLLPAGSVLWMLPPLQRDFQHQLPKMAKAGARLNLTFRHIVINT
jgi:alkylated DNA repair dioxygenase AlkB